MGQMVEQVVKMDLVSSVKKLIPYIPLGCKVLDEKLWQEAKGSTYMSIVIRDQIHG